MTDSLTNATSKIESRISRVLKTARTQLRGALEGAIASAEKASGSLFRYARKVTTRLDAAVTRPD